MNVVYLVLLLIVIVANCLTAAAVIIYMKRQFARLTPLRRDLSDLQGFVWDAMYIYNRLNPRSPLPHPYDWAATPDLLVEIIRFIDDEGGSKILELGAGVTTIVIATLLKEKGRGKLISIEHDEQYAAQIREDLNARGLLEFVEVRVAPLSSLPGAETQTPWYGVGSFADLSELDLIIVDGPPKKFGDEVRGPAGKQLFPRLRPGGLLILDDARRAGETRIRKRWADEFPNARCHYRDTGKGIFLMKNTGS